MNNRNTAENNRGNNREVSPRLLAGLALALLLGTLSLAGPLMAWPMLDESTYVLQARQMAEGLLPYRDFYDFVTPGSQFIGSLFIRLNGFSMLGLRLAVVLGWLMQVAMLYPMARNHLPKVWLGLFLVFFWLTGARYPIFQHHFWSGLSAMASVFMAWRYLQSLYDGKAQSSQHKWISYSGLFCAATFWITQSLGALLAGGLLLYSLLHCFLHEREEKGLSYPQVDKRAVLSRWTKSWGLYGVLPWLGFHMACVGLLVWLGIWPDFLRDTFQWLAGGHYNKTSLLGYYPTFHTDFREAIKPFIDGVPFPAILLFSFRFATAFHFFLIGLLPIIGLLGMGYQLPNRLHYRLLQRQDDELLLFLLCGLAMIVSTMTYSTAMHIVSNGGIAFLLGFVVIYRALAHKPAQVKRASLATGVLCGLLLLSAVTDSLTTLVFSPWISPGKAMPGPFTYTNYRTQNTQLSQLLNELQNAETQGRTVFIFCETPSLYLAGNYRNATRFSLIIPQYTSPPQIAEILRDLERKQPLYIVDDGILAVLPHDPRFAAYSPRQLTLPEIDAFVRQNYTLQGQYGGFRLYRHR